MKQFLKLSVLLVLLSVATAAAEFEYDEKVLKDNHEYDYNANIKVAPLNAGAVEKMKMDDFGYPYPDVLMVNRVKGEENLDKKCSGHLGALHPVSSEAYCLEEIHVDMKRERVPRIATFQLRMRTPDNKKVMVLMMPLFKDSAAAKDKKVLRFEPFTSEHVSSLPVNPKTIDFSAPWIKVLLEQPVNKFSVGTPSYTDYVTYPVVMPAEKFEALQKLVEKYTNEPYPL